MKTNGGNLAYNNLEVGSTTKYIVQNHISYCLEEQKVQIQLQGCHLPTSSRHLIPSGEWMISYW
jgi:hypothetical protein